MHCRRFFPFTFGVVCFGAGLLAAFAPASWKEITSTERSPEVVTEVHTPFPVPNADNGPLFIEYVSSTLDARVPGSSDGPDRLELLFRVTNNTDQNIYYPGEFEGEIHCAYAPQNATLECGYSKFAGAGVRGTRRIIKPRHSRQISVKVDTSSNYGKGTAAEIYNTPFDARFLFQDTEQDVLVEVTVAKQKF